MAAAPWMTGINTLMTANQPSNGGGPIERALEGAISAAIPAAILSYTVNSSGNYNGSVIAGNAALGAVTKLFL